MEKVQKGGIDVPFVAFWSVALGLIVFLAMGTAMVSERAGQHSAEMRAGILRCEGWAK